MEVVGGEILKICREEIWKFVSFALPLHSIYESDLLTKAGN